MNNRELYQQKLQAQLDEWKADVDKLKARTAKASADAQISMKRQAEVLEGKLEEGKAKLHELSNASEEAWGSLKQGGDAAWSALSSAFKDAAGKFKSDKPPQ